MSRRNLAYATVKRAVSSYSPTHPHVLVLEARASYRTPPFRAGTHGGCRQVMGLTNQTAVDFGPEGIRINAICPGFMVHPQNDDALRDDEEMQEYFREQYPVGRCEPHVILSDVRGCA
eukprot:COSAG04_NODE_8305_length_993_cov_0.970917_2_plen_118_part_00